MRELRTTYLGDFAHLLHITPAELDALRLRDFAGLTLWVDEYRAEMARRNSET